MERREMEAFLTLAEELHFGRTGERLHMSTAQVSKAISRLEREVGTALFTRTSRKVALTPVGQRLRDDALPGWEILNEAVARAVRAGRGVAGTLRAGFVGAAAGVFMMKVAQEFRRGHPGLEVRIKESHFGDGFGGMLRSDEIDVLLAVLPVDEPDLARGPVLLWEDRTLAVSARHPFADRDAITFEDIARTVLLRSPSQIPGYWDASLAPAHTRDGRPIERGPAFTTIQEMLTLVGAGAGTYPVPARASEFYQRPDVRYVPIADAPPFEWVLIWLADGDTATLRAFRETAEQMVATRET